MRFLGTPIDLDKFLAAPAEVAPPPEPEYVTQLREELSELRDRVRSLEERDRFYHGGNSDDE